MNKTAISVLLSVWIILLCSSLQAQNPYTNEQCKKLGRGVNIIGYDKELWKDHTKGRFKEGYFKMIKEAGFSNVRINLHPFSNMDKSYVIKPAWLETLDWAVKNSLDAGLMVILDLHEFNAMAQSHPDSNYRTSKLERN